MRSRQEIEKEINRLLTLEKEVVKEMKKHLGSSYLELDIQKANALQTRRLTLLWVLQEDQP